MAGPSFKFRAVLSTLIVILMWSRVSFPGSCVTGFADKISRLVYAMAGLLVAAGTATGLNNLYKFAVCLLSVNDVLVGTPQCILHSPTRLCMVLFQRGLAMPVLATLLIAPHTAKVFLVCAALFFASTLAGFLIAHWELKFESLEAISQIDEDSDFIYRACVTAGLAVVLALGVIWHSLSQNTFRRRVARVALAPVPADIIGNASHPSGISVVPGGSSDVDDGYETEDTHENQTQLDLSA